MFPNNDPVAFMVAFYGCLLAEVVPVPIEVPLSRKVLSRHPLPSPSPPPPLPAIPLPVNRCCPSPRVLLLSDRMLVVSRLGFCWAAVALPWR